MLNALVKVSVPHNEYQALVQMCETECRMPDEQLRYLLRTEAQRRGLLEAEQPYLQLKEGERDAATVDA